MMKRILNWLKKRHEELAKARSEQRMVGRIGGSQKAPTESAEPKHHTLDIDWDAMRSDSRYQEMVERTIRKLP